MTIIKRLLLVILFLPTMCGDIVLLIPMGIWWVVSGTYYTVSEKLTNWALN